MDIEQVILTLVVIFALAKGASLLFAKFGMPGLIGEIILGIIIANLVIGDFSFKEFLDLDGHTATHNILEVFSELGVIFLLFTVGLETKVKDLTSVGKAAILVAVLGVLVPFVVGYAYVMFIYDGNLYHALFMGAAMVATSVGITARVIKDMKLMDAKESRIIIGAAVIDDILGMIVLAIVSGMAETGGELNIGSVLTVAITAIIFVLIILVVAAKFVPSLYNAVEKKKEDRLASDPTYVPQRPNMFVIAIIVCLAVSYLATLIGLAAIIGAFLAGMLFAEHGWEWHLEEKFESITTLFVSFFFVYVGMNVSLTSFIENTSLITLAIIIIVLACLTKFIGCGFGAKIADPSIDMSSLSIIGCGMMPRGEVGIIIALLGTTIMLDGSSALSSELYSVIVMMCIATTLIAPPILSKLYRKKYKEEYVITDSDRL